MGKSSDVKMKKNNQKILRASSYYLEDVLGLKLDERAEQGKISFLLLNQPPICDAHCRRCFMPEYRRKLGSKDSLTLDESKKVLDQAKDYGALCLEISGEGEPVLNKNLPEIIKHANKAGYLTTLITNGHNLTQEQIELYKDSNVTLIFSHHSLDKSRYEADNSECGSFQNKMKNLEYAIQTYNETIEKQNGFDVYRLAIHTTLQKDNVQDTLDLKDYCHKKEMLFSVAPLAQVGCAVEHPEMKLEKTVNINEKDIPLTEVPRILGDNSIIYSHSSKREVGREVCGTCFYGLNIGYDGAVLFDAHTGYDIGNMLGNVRYTDFSQIIKDQRKITKKLFANIDGFCPIRDPKWDGFLQKVLSGEVQL